MSILGEMPMDEKVHNMALAIVNRALHYNNTKTRQGLTGNKPTFFTDLSGHTAEINVRIYPNGYVEGGEKEQYVVYLTENKFNPLDDIKSQLSDILKRMEEVYTAWYEKENPHDE